VQNAHRVQIHELCIDIHPPEIAHYHPRIRNLVRYTSLRTEIHRETLARCHSCTLTYHLWQNTCTPPSKTHRYTYQIRKHLHTTRPCSCTPFIHVHAHHSSMFMHTTHPSDLRQSRQSQQSQQSRQSRPLYFRNLRYIYISSLDVACVCLNISVRRPHVHMTMYIFGKAIIFIACFAITDWLNA